MQSKKHSILESMANVIIGLLVSFCIQIVIYSAMNIKVSIDQNIVITLVFFMASFIRGYLIRRFFNNLQK